MKNKHLVVLMRFLFCLGIATTAQAQTTKIMQYNTGFSYDESMIYLYQDAVPIGADFLSVRMYGPEHPILYIFDLKQKKIAMKLDQADFFNIRYVRPSGTTSSFVLEYEDTSGAVKISLYSSNKKNRTWSLVPDTDRIVTTGYSAAGSTPLLPGFFVNTVSRNGTLWLDVYKY